MRPAAVITGASGGIGKAISIKFARAGYRLFLGGFHRRHELSDFARSLAAAGCEAEAIFGDLSRPEGALNFSRKVLDLCPEPQVLINCAGVAQQKLFQDITDDDWRRVLGVNLDAAFYVTRAFLPSMIRAKYGRVIFISSVWGICGASCEAHYSAAKAAVIGMTKSLAKELGPSGITVNCIAPGAIDTPMLSGFSQDDLDDLTARTPAGRLGTGEDVARLALFLADGESDFITGQVISVDGGFAL